MFYVMCVWIKGTVRAHKVCNCLNCRPVYRVRRRLGEGRKEGQPKGRRREVDRAVKEMKMVSGEKGAATKKKEGHDWKRSRSGAV